MTKEDWDKLDRRSQLTSIPWNPWKERSIKTIPMRHDIGNGIEVSANELAQRLKDSRLYLQILHITAGHRSTPRFTAATARELAKLYESGSLEEKNEFFNGLRDDLKEKHQKERLYVEWDGSRRNVTPEEVIHDLFEADLHSLPEKKLEIHRTQDEDRIFWEEQRRKWKLESQLKGFDYSTQKEDKRIEIFKKANSLEQRMEILKEAPKLTQFRCIDLLEDPDPEKRSKPAQELFDALLEKRTAHIEDSNLQRIALLTFYSDYGAFLGLKELTDGKFY